MDVFSVKELNFSIVNSDQYDRDTARDTLTPYSFLDFIKYLQTEYAPEKYSSFYSLYLKKWYALKSDNTEEQKQLYIEFYREFIKEVVIKYSTQVERRFLSNVNYNSPTDLDIIIPFYANKLTEVATFYRSKREEAKYVVDKNKIKGSVLGIERAIFDNIYNYVVNSSDALLAVGVGLNDIVKDFGISLHEYVDVYGDYFDLIRSDADEDLVRKELYENNLMDIDPDYYFDPEALKVLRSNSFLSLLGGFTINPPTFNQNDITSICSPEDNIVEQLNEEYTKGGLTLAEVYRLKTQLISKYVSSDFYYIDTTGNTTTSGLLFEADQPTNNLLNLQTADVAAVQSNHQKILRDVGLFFKPDDFGIFKLNAGKASLELDVDKLEQDKVYVFPDPNVYGNVGVNAVDSYPFIHIYDYRDNIRNISSGIAVGDPKITNKSLTFEPYSTKQRDIQELTNLNTLGYRLNFTDLYNRGAIRKMAYDCFGNEYALFKAEGLQERDTTTTGAILSLRLDGHTFYDEIFGEEYDFNYSISGCDAGKTFTIRSGLTAFTDQLSNVDDPYYLSFRKFTPYDELRGALVCGLDELSTNNNFTVSEGTNLVALPRDGGGFTLGDGSELPDPIKTGEPGYPSNKNYYYQIFTDGATFSDDIRSITNWQDYNCGKFSDVLIFERQFNYNEGNYLFIDSVHSSSTTVISTLTSEGSGTINADRVFQPGDLYVKDQGTSLSHPLSSILSNTLDKYSAEVQDDIYNNLIDFDVVRDTIFLQTHTRLLIDKINYSDRGTFDKPNTSNTVFSVNSGDTLNVFSNRLNVNEIETCGSSGSVLFTIFKTLSTDLSDGSSLPSNYWYVYPEIYQYSFSENQATKIYPQELNDSDLESFSTGFPGLSSDFAPEKVKSPILTYNSSQNKLKLTYIILDQNNFSHIGDCLFEWRGGILTLNRVARYIPDNLILRTTTFSTDTTFTAINKPTGTFIIENNTLCI